MDDVTIRRVTEDERLAYLRFVLDGFHEHQPDDVLRTWFDMMREGRYDVAVRDGEMVGSAAAAHGTLSVPGGTIGSAEVTAVTVRPDARRRGLLTAMMARIFDEAIAEGRHAAALYASEGGIYGRFGYGPAVPMRSLEVAHARARLAVAADPSRVRVVTADRAREVLPDLYERVRDDRPGMVHATSAWWDLLTTIDPEEERDGWSARRYGAIDGVGVVVYRTRHDGGADQAGRLKVELLVAAQPTAVLDLWAFVASIDLIGTIELPARPLDDPLLLALADETRVRLSRGDSLWLRLLDVPGALEARTTAWTGEVVVELADPVVPTNAGRWRIGGEAGHLSCDRTDRAPDLALDVAALSTCYLGGVRPTALVDARRVVEQVPGAAVTLQRLLATARAPWAPLDF